MPSAVAELVRAADRQAEAAAEPQPEPEPEPRRGGTPDLSKVVPDVECDECGWTPNPLWPYGLKKAHLTRHRKQAHGFSPPPKEAPKRKARQPKVEAEPRPARTSRKSTAKLLSWVWEGFGTMMPGRVGGVITYEAPAAGPVLDKALAGSFVDRVLLQRVAKVEDKYEPVFLLMVPVMAAMAADMGQPLPPVMEPLLRDAFLSIWGEHLAWEAKQKARMDDLSAKARAAGKSDDLEAEYEAFKAAFGLGTVVEAQAHETPQ